MGSSITRLVLYEPVAGLWPLARVIRPAAPNHAQPAVDFAEDLADFKANVLIRAWLDSLDIDASMPAQIGSSHVDDLARCFDLHGGELDVWWTSSTRRSSSLAIAHADDELEFWAQVADALSDKQLAELRRPATLVRARVITEADVRLVDHPVLLVEDVEWLSAEEFARLHRGDELAALLGDGLALGSDVTSEQLRAAKRALVVRALAEDLAWDDRRAAAFRLHDLARFDADAAAADIEALVDAVRSEDDHPSIAFALAWALDTMRGLPSCDALLSRWHACGGLRAQVLAELALRARADD